MSNENQYASAHVVASQLGRGIEQAAELLRKSLAGHTPDLVIAIAAGFAPEELDQDFPSIQPVTGADYVIGCSCESMLCDGIELENEKAIGLWAASFVDASIQMMHLRYQRSPDGGGFVGWPDGFELDSGKSDGCMIMLGEPYGFPADVLLERFNEDAPGMAVVGGMASGAYQPGEARLVFNDSVQREGAVAIYLEGAKVSSVVSQGCRPIGKPCVITAAERNVIFQLGGKSAYSELQDVFQELPTRDQRLVQRGLHVGRVMSEYKDKFGYGDFLIRNVVGLDEDNGSIAIGDYVRPGQTVQFHVRDAESASAELCQLLTTTRESFAAKAALVFTCNGRGLNLFSDPHHDASMVQSICGSIPALGFFAAGEIGPVSNRNFLHGFTASVALFE